MNVGGVPEAVVVDIWTNVGVEVTVIDVLDRLWKVLVRPVIKLLLLSAAETILDVLSVVAV